MHDPRVMVGLLDLLMPPACASCSRMGAIICAACLQAFQAPSRPADRFLAADAGVVVGESLSLAMAAFAYEAGIRRALAALKYGGASRVAPIVAKAAVPALRRLLAVSGPAMLVPIPISDERRRTRGYNQAELIARQLARSAHLPTAEVLDRIRPTARQHRLSRMARLRNLQDALAARPGARMPTVAILVDDIITTAATLEAGASVLRAAGCDAVYGFAIAREV